MSGQVLAPNAALTFQNPINGSVFAKTIDAKSEVHFPSYAGSLRTISSIPVPEPGSALLTGLAALFPILLRRKA